VLAATDGEASWQRADRALLLHMLAGHAPAFFRAAGLEPVLADAMTRLGAVPTELHRGLDKNEAMARLDALYLRRLRGGGRADVDEAALASCVQAIAEADLLYGWLLAELAAASGLRRPLSAPPRALRRQSRAHDLYWLTHLFLLATDYLARRLPATGWESEIEELLAGATYAVESEQVDLAAEIAVCLQLAGEEAAADNREILALLARYQQRDGSVQDPSADGGGPASASEAARVAAHATAASLLAFAGTVSP
jgi:hypothetical protein